MYATLGDKITSGEVHSLTITTYTAEEFGDEAKKCYDAGAAIVNIHDRHPEKGNPTNELD